MAARPPNIPLSIEEVTPAWLTEVLGYEIDTNNFTVTPNTEEGNGMLSCLLRVSCEAVEKKEKMDLIVKLLPEEEFMKQLVVTQRLDQTEIQAYRIALPHLAQVLPALENFFCPFLYGDYRKQEAAYASVLILQDLKPLEYSTLQFNQRLTTAQIDQGIDFLVKLHFAGCLIERQERRPLTSVFNFLNLHDDEFGLLSEMCRLALINLDQHLTDERAKEAFRFLSQNTAPMMEYVRKKCNAYPIIAQGDLWPHNILCSEDRTKHTKVIDWQLLGYRDPTVDVGVYLTSCLPNELFTLESLQIHARKYYDRFTKICEENNAQEFVRRGWSEFSMFFNSYGLAYTMIWFIMSMDGMISKNRERFLIIIDFLFDGLEIPQLIMQDLKRQEILNR